jgi:hypothetical protein
MRPRQKRISTRPSTSPVVSKPGPGNSALPPAWRGCGSSRVSASPLTLLAPVYEWFTEGFDTADLQEANALLVELR